jgi:hypothetical protein
LENVYCPPNTSIMHCQRLLFIFVCFLLVFSSCEKKKKPSLSGNEKVEVADFIESFAQRDLPFQFADTSLSKKDNDSFLISKKVVAQFIPDSVMSNLLGKTLKYKSYPLGRVVGNDGVNYLFMKTVAGDKKSILLLVFDKKEQFIAGMIGLKPDNSNLTFQSLSIDKRYSITKMVRQKNVDGSISEGKDVYALNESAKSFTLIMTDAIGEKITDLINPIDTLSRKHKYAADYGAGKMNLVSVRDGIKPDRVSFFIHFEKENGQCTGEIKGEAFWKTANMAEYREDGDVCIMKLLFSPTAVTIKEENCGSKRNSISCVFDGSFTKIKYKKPVTSNVKATEETKKTVKK